MVKSASRTIAILELLSTNPEGLQAKEISAALGLAPSSCHGLLATLTAERAVRVLHSGAATRFTLGPLMFRIGMRYGQTTDVIREGQSVADALCAAETVTAHVASLDGPDVVYIAKAEPRSPVRMASAIGQVLRAHSTGVGKILIAGLPDIVLKNRYGVDGALGAVTKNTITSWPALRDQIEDIRARGVASEREESSEGIACVAAGVYNSDGLICALSASTPAAHMTNNRAEELSAAVTAHAADMSERLGAPEYPTAISPGTTREHSQW